MLILDFFCKIKVVSFNESSMYSFSDPFPLAQSEHQNILNPRVQIASTQKIPFTSVKKIMKSSSQVRMVAGDAPHLCVKACEIFIKDITLRSLVNVHATSPDPILNVQVPDFT